MAFHLRVYANPYDAMLHLFNNILPEKPLDVMYLDSFRLFPNVILHYPPSVAL